ncbi:MAG: MlaD family protein [Parvularculaceae bacterium]
METRAHYVLIGSVVLAMIACAGLFILWIGQNRASYDEYDIVFRERVSGLTKGAPVRFNGIQKGEVLELSIAPDDPSVVVARVRVEDDTPVKTDTNAELELVGFTGLAVIQLVGGTGDAELLKRVERGVPRIEADASGFAAFLVGSGDIVASANRLLSSENTDAVAAILADVSAVTAAIAEEDEAIGETIRNAAEMTEYLAQAAERLERAAVSIEALAAGEAPAAFEEAQAALAEARGLMEELRGVVEDNRDPISAFTEQGLAQIGPLVVEARRAFRSLDQVLREVDRDPRGYILGQSTPRYEGEER